MTISLLKVAEFYNFEPSEELRTRLQLSSFSQTIACGFVRWLPGLTTEDIERYTVQYEGQELRSFPDNSDLYEDLMIDLDDFEIEAEDLPTEAIYVYSFSRGSNIFSDYSEPQGSINFSVFYNTVNDVNSRAAA